MFELCAPTIELDGQNGVFLASVVPKCVGFVSDTKVACVAMVHIIGRRSCLSMCAGTMVAVI